MMSEKQVIDYDNLAFNPYAISTGDLIAAHDNIKSNKSMENHGYEGEAVIENNPHYEDTLEVAKKAGLTGTGPRKKENVVYEETKIKKKTVPMLRDRNSNLPARPTEEWQGPNKNNEWKMPFAILCFLIILCLVCGAFGVLAYLKNKECSCVGSGQANTAESRAPQPTKSSENLTEIVQQLSQQLKELKAKLVTVEEKQQEQRLEQDTKLNNVTKFSEKLRTRIDDINSTFNIKRVEQNTKLNNVTKFSEKLRTRIDDINSTFNIKLNNVKSNVLNLAKKIDKFNVTLWDTNIFSQQLSDIIDDFNSTFTLKLNNVSKQIGPRGYNGSQGSQGMQGIGNLSLCVVEEDIDVQPTSQTQPESTKVQVFVKEEPGWKIMAVYCSTNEQAGAGQTALSYEKPDKYVCTCAGESKYKAFKPVNSEIECVIRYWKCPILT